MINQGNTIRVYKKLFDIGGSEIILSDQTSIRFYLYYFSVKRAIKDLYITSTNELEIALHPDQIRQTGIYYYRVSITDENNNVYTTELKKLLEVSKSEGVVISTDKNINIGIPEELMMNFYTKSEIDHLMKNIDMIGDILD